MTLGDSSKTARPGYALNRPVNKRGAVNRENGEFGGLKEANGLNHDGSARGPVGGVSNWRTAPKRKYWRMFGLTRRRKRRWRQAKWGGGKLRFLGVAPRHGFEPRFTAPKAAVLPLDDPARFKIVIHLLELHQQQLLFYRDNQNRFYRKQLL